MSKTPEQMATDWILDNRVDMLPHPCKSAFLAGYQAAKDEYKVAIDTYNDVAKQMLEEAVRIMSPKDQLADADKVMCNTTMEEIKAVDTGELMPITNLPTPAKWISVKERLPEDNISVLAFVFDSIEVGYIETPTTDNHEFHWIGDHNYIDKAHRAITHWMPLPEAPKEEK